MTADNSLDRGVNKRFHEIPSEEGLIKWGRQVANCGGRHDGQGNLEVVRKITYHPDFSGLTI